METKTRLELLKIREKQLANKETSFESPGALQKIRRRIRLLEKKVK